MHNNDGFTILVSYVSATRLSEVKTCLLYFVLGYYQSINQSIRFYFRQKTSIVNYYQLAAFILLCNGPVPTYLCSPFCLPVCLLLAPDSRTKSSGKLTI